MDLRFQKRTSVRMEIFREKEENEGERERMDRLLFDKYFETW